MEARTPLEGLVSFIEVWELPAVSLRECRSGLLPLVDQQSREASRAKAWERALRKWRVYRGHSLIPLLRTSKSLLANVDCLWVVLNCT